MRNTSAGIASAITSHSTSSLLIHQSELGNRRRWGAAADRPYLFLFHCRCALRCQIPVLCSPFGKYRALMRRGLLPRIPATAATLKNGEAKSKFEHQTQHLESLSVSVIKCHMHLIHLHSHIGTVWRQISTAPFSAYLNGLCGWRNP